MKLLLKGGRVVDPRNRLDGTMDVLIEAGKIVSVGAGTDAPTGTGEIDEIDARGKLVLPGLIDMHVHLREPGREDEETIETGTLAAVRGGFVAVACMPNTDPPIDTAAAVSFVRSRARECGHARVLPVGAITKGCDGAELAEIGELSRAGAVAISDDGRPVASSRIMRYAMEYASTFGLPVISHSEDLELSAGGAMNEGYWSTRLGLPGIPAAAEEIMVARDIILAELTGARLHIAHVSTAGSVELVRRAKERGAAVTCEVTPHHLALTDEAVAGYDTNTKVNPPLRSRRDVEALRAGLLDGTIDAVASDHAPHTREEKEVEYELAAPGMIGLETSLPVVFTELVKPGVLTLQQLVDKMSYGPARILGLDWPGIVPGACANLTLLDPDASFVVDPAAFASASRNTPFAGRRLSGKVVATIVDGVLSFDARTAA
ncbi:MAG: dihydroorotase [Firmicutes bacterium]|nr:dihydroorotase [Bacillota bacterium]MDH7495038.1 dihydroorotase [Bacillota bacterium]